MSPPPSNSLRFPEPKFNLFSTASFWWVNPLVFWGFKKPLTQDDLYKIPPDRAAKAAYHSFREYWTPMVTTSIVLPLFKSNFDGILTSVLFRGLLSLSMFIPAIVLDQLLTWVVHRDPYHMGYVYAGIMFASSVIDSILSGQYEYVLSIASMKMRSAANEAIYQKSLRLSPDSRNKYTTGQIVNLMSVDTNRLHELVMFFNVIWSCGFQITIALYLLWQQLGIATLAGLAVMLVSIPITFFVARTMRLSQNELMTKKDDRSKLMNQILAGIKVIKMYGWEQPLKEQVTEIRKDERKRLTKLCVIYSFTTFTQDAAPIFVAIASLATFTLIDDTNSLTASKAFVSLALFNLIRTPLYQLPFITQFLSNFMVSSKRMNDFLNSEESDPNVVQKIKESKDAVCIESGSFKWSKDDSSPVILNDISLELPKHKLIAVVGQVGSGKSSLLSAILGEMYKLSGCIKVTGSFAYVPQVAWIQNKTLKENVLFKHRPKKLSDIDDSRYQDIIKATALDTDISVLQAGDGTEIGEKGINLSGGQKQRVSLARAVYQNSDTYLLDDPLSAVDSHVGQHIFDHVIGPKGLLKDKTRILVTHRINVLPSTDLIVVMKDGRVSEIGTYQELLDQKGDFSALMQEYSKEQDDEVAGDQVADSKEESTMAKSAKDDITQEKVEDKGKLISDEKEEIGKVSMSIYMKYFRSAGFFVCFFVLFMVTVSSGFNLMSSLWLSKWAEDGRLNNTVANDTSLRDLRLQVYSGLALFEALTLFMSDVLIFLSALRASCQLHDSMLSRILRAPMSFFDTTPVGRILNRFTKDVDGLDVYMSFYIRFSTYSSFKVLVAVTVISIQNPYFLIVVFPLSVVYYLVRRFFIPSSRQLKRIEATTKSPIYSHFSETVSGSACIKAFGAKDQFVREFEERCDANSSPWLLSVAVTRWSSFRLEFIGSVIILSAVLLSVISQDTNAARVGLSISYALLVTYHLNLLVRFSADLENNIVAAERILEYTAIESEAAEKVQNSELTHLWPQAGGVRFENYSTRYRPELDLILKDVSFEVNPKEKVGIVGRTGAGKSSLTLALFRIIEPVTGRIIIDGLDISKIGLDDLRSKLTIIPQDSALFTGSLRMNLDPFGLHSDEEIWSVLGMADLKKFVSGLETGLNHEVSEGGENFSVGQRQLLCLARALLRKSKILILDEATAAVDVETDSLIQNTIQEQFPDCTIITIAHRLNTVLDYDRILVLDNGHVAEFDTPTNLLNNPDSIFYSMAKTAGLVPTQN